MKRAGESLPRLLVVYAHYAPTLSYYDDWLQAFVDSPLAHVTSFDLCAQSNPHALERALKDHDAAVLLHSTNGDTLDYLRTHQQALSQRSTPLACFVGNEVNIPGSPIAEKIAFLKEVQPAIICTQLPLEAGQWLYESCSRSYIAAVPHALQPQVFEARVPDAQRDIDIGVRTARYTAYLGDNDRNRLLDFFLDPARSTRFKTDISTTERFARAEWARFLNRARATVINEAGSWYLERDDRTVNAIRAWVLEQERARGGIVIAADSPLRRLGHRLPWWMRAMLRRALGRGPLRHEALVNESVDFDAIYDRFFANASRAPVYSKAISSRHFDAIGTRTCQIMLRGRFNDILVADEHYLALDHDFSNADDVLRRFADVDERTTITAAAHELAMSQHTYAHRVATVVDLLDRHGQGA